MLAKNNKYDLVIVGSGLSGAAAATQASLNGLKTLVLEKGHSTGGTGNYVEGVFAVESKLQKQLGIKITQKEVLNEEKSWTHSLADMEVWREYVSQSAKNIEWLMKNGVKISKMKTLGSGINTWHLFEGHGNEAINKGLLPTCEKNGGEVITSAKAIQLIIDKQGRIQGIKIQNLENKKEQFIETKNIILATGGYLNNSNMLDSNSNHNSERIIPVNSGKNDGDGLKLAWKVGAKKFGMGTIMIFGGQVYDPTVPGYRNWMRQINRAATHEAVLWVNETGERFADENCTDLWSDAGNTLIRQEKVFAIIDQSQINHLIEHSFKGSFDYNNLQKDIIDDLSNRKSYLTKANSIKELAEKLNLPDLVKNVERYNFLADIKKDYDFGKSKEYLHKIEDGVVYAIELGVGAFCTLGGLRTDHKNRVLNNKGKVIEGLYAIGSDGSACLVGDTYDVKVPGSEAGYCIYSGRNAVKNLIK